MGYFRSKEECGSLAFDVYDSVISIESSLCSVALKAEVSKNRNLENKWRYDKLG